MEHPTTAWLPLGRHRHRDVRPPRPPPPPRIAPVHAGAILLLSINPASHLIIILFSFFLFLRVNDPAVQPEQLQGAGAAAEEAGAHRMRER